MTKMEIKKLAQYIKATELVREYIMYFDESNADNFPLDDSINRIASIDNLDLVTYGNIHNKFSISCDSHLIIGDIYDCDGYILDPDISGTDEHFAFRLAKLDDINFDSKFPVTQENRSEICSNE